MNGSAPDEINLMDYIQVLRKRKWLVIIGTLLCMVAAGVVSFLMPKVYEAKTYLMVTSPKYQVEFASKEGSKISTPIFQSISAETFSKIILNEHTARAVMTKNALDQLPEKYSVGRLLNQTKVEYPRNTNLILLKVEDKSGDRAARIANAWASAFIDRNEEVTSKETTNTYNFVIDQLEKAKSSLKTAEEELERFQKTNRTELVKEQISGKIRQIVQYESRLDDAICSQLIEKARHKELMAQLKEQERTVHVPSGPYLSNIEESINSLLVGIHDLTAGMTVEEADALIKKQLELALSGLTRAEDEYKEFSQKNRIEVLQSQIDRKVGQLADMKLRMTDLDINLEKQRIGLKMVDQELQKENKYISVDKGLIGKEEINPLYLSLTSKRADTVISISLIEKEKSELLRTQSPLEHEIQKMKGDLAVQRLDDSRLKRRLSLAESNYNALARKREQSKLAAEARNPGKDRIIGHTSVMVKDLKDALMKADINIQSLNAEISQLRENIKNLNGEVGGLKKEVAEQELIQTRFIRGMETAKSTFDILSKKGEETRISSAIKSATIQVSVPATPPEFPIKPKKAQNIMIAGLAGLLASIMMAFFMEFLEKNRMTLQKPI